MLDDTIAAIATPLGESGIGVIRISGPDTLKVLAGVFRLDSGEVPRISDWDSHHARYGYVVEPDSGEKLDEVMALLMRKPRSYTGEDVLELSCHGGPLVLQRVLEAVYRGGARQAERGEFTKRAFLNGKLDLTQAEAVIDLIGARSDDSHRLALEQLVGRLSGEVEELREELLGIVARIEVVVDFPDEDVDALGREDLSKTLEELVGRIRKLLATSRTGRLIREGLKTAIVGRPNVGKSSLLNALLKEDRAIVTSEPGTTRDTIEERVSVGGVPIALSDTAGVREAVDEVERLGVERTRKVLERAEVAIVVLDDSEGLTDDDLRLCNEVAERELDFIVVINKVDLGRGSVENEDVRQWVVGCNDTCGPIRVSALTGEGLDELEEKLRQKVYHTEGPQWERAVVTRARHREALESAAESIEQAVKTIEGGIPVDMATVDLREAVMSLGEITGETVEDAVLERIFADFCVGK